ncbi:MAG: ferredoxin [Candidatus Diapherotrites archaeon]|nr:ferredoxin [Candidatus Diapherotrites archaeon]
MANFKIVHDRPNCIGCGACAAVAPDYWEMSPVDGKSDVKNCTKVGDQEEKELEELGPNKDAADACPVNVIHLYDLKENKKLI